MADFAILTGISRYPNPGYSQLTGPPNDLALVEQWLTDPARGGLDPARVAKIVTPQPYPLDTDPAFDLDRAPPVPEDFDAVFKKMLRERMKLGAARVADRLYLYFSGHGFCNRSQEKAAEAALYCANATKEAYEHIFGTYYARVAVSWALFAEVVLIMDCCRDSEIARVPMPRPYRDTPDDGLAAEVKLLALYAVPKGGKAQERPIAERGGKVYGLLTHALFKLLDELPPSAGAGPGLLSSSDLRQNLLQSWVSLCGEDAAPRPEVYLPASGDIMFRALNLGSPFEFRLHGAALVDASLTLSDAGFQDVAVFPLGAVGTPLVPAGGPVIGHQRVNGTLKLRMRPGLYQYRVNGPVPRKDAFKVDGSDGHVDL